MTAPAGAPGRESGGPSAIRWWRVWDPLDLAVAVTWRFRGWSLGKDATRVETLRDSDFRSMVVSALVALTGVYIIATAAIGAALVRLLDSDSHGLAMDVVAAATVGLPLGVLVAWYAGFRGLRRQAAAHRSTVAAWLLRDPAALSATRRRGLALTVGWVVAVVWLIPLATR